MDKRFFMGLLGFVVFVGGGLTYLLRAKWEKVKQLRSLMSLPKKDRKLWYRLRMRGCQIVACKPVARVRVLTPEDPFDVTLQLEWLVRWQNERWAVIRKPFTWGEKQCFQSFFAALVLHRVTGVLWYEEESGMILPWKIEKRQKKK